MSVNIVVVGLLKDYTKGKSTFELPAGMTVIEIIQTLKIPNELVAGVFVNDRAQPKSYLPLEGDTVKLIAVIGGGRTEE